MNKVFLVGNVGADAELRATATEGEGVLKFRLATNRYGGKASETEDKTDWHTVTVFGKRAVSLAQYVTKGTKLAVDGSIRYGSYEKDGVTRYTTDIIANNVEFTGSKRGTEEVEDSL